MKLRVVVALSSIALLGSASFAAAPAIVPEKFSAVIGGFFGSTYAVELRDGALHYREKRQTPGGYREVSSATVTPTDREWEEFRKSLDELNIWQWRAEYPRAGTVDGTQWALEIKYGDHALKTHGDNNYPDTSGTPNGKPESTKTFSRYLAAISKLIGGRKFE